MLHLCVLDLDFFYNKNAINFFDLTFKAEEGNCYLEKLIAFPV